MYIKNKTIKYKKLICNPKNNYKDNNTCFTKKAINNLIKKYNSKKNKTKINNYRDLLKVYSNKCNNEICVLKQLYNNNEIEDKLIYFAPIQPIDWKYNFNEWLSNYDIINVIKQYEDKYNDFHFIGPTTIDFNEKIDKYNCVDNELCNFKLSNYYKYNSIGIIFNTDVSTGKGEHWVSLYIDIKNKYIFYFDSVGNNIPTPINIFIKKIYLNEKRKNNIYKIYVNKQEHQKTNSECGVYSLFFMISMISNCIGGNIKYKFKNNIEKIKFFLENILNDKFIEKYRNIFFNKI